MTDINVNALSEAINDKLDRDMDNLLVESTESKNIANWSNNVTNCITEIPQDIKLELNNGILTLKAGSKVYVPNGNDVFNQITINSDMTVLTYTTTGQVMVVVDLNQSHCYGNQLLNVWYSGSTPPSAGMFYNTTTNYIDYYSAGSLSDGHFSFPLGIITVNNGSVTSIDQIFNGFGYIGSTVFALPGVKGLIPNGRNTDGTLKSISFISSNVVISPLNTYTIGSIYYVFTGTDLIPYDTAHYWYKEEENKNFQNYANAYVYATPICHCSLTSGVVSNFIPKTIYHPVDYSEADFVIAFQRPTSSNDYTWYRLYKSGWIEQGGRLPTQGTTTTVTLPHAMADTNYSVLTQEAEDGSTDTDGVDFCCLVCVRTTTTIKFSTVSGARRSFYEVKGFAA